MKTVLPIAILAIAFAAHADPSEDAMKFLAVPGAMESYTGRDARVKAFQRAALPKGLVEILAGQYWGRADGSVPDSLDGYAIDLNKDGKDEYFIETVWGGSGGPAFMVMSERQGAWNVILDFQGGFSLVRSKTAWPDIVTTSRGGGGTFSKRTFKFKETKYQETIRERYDNGKTTRTVMSALTQKPEVAK